MFIVNHISCYLRDMWCTIVRIRHVNIVCINTYDNIFTIDCNYGQKANLSAERLRYCNVYLQGLLYVNCETYILLFTWYVVYQSRNSYVYIVIINMCDNIFTMIAINAKRQISTLYVTYILILTYMDWS
jgi:hypothetical protein